ncbi:response regulator [Nocardia sp. NPDC005978]|uniref:response regulator transcription factor n=1 Tax=unclassified Nocardia TaxID=2637762 RepID=UPI0033B31B32
MNTHQLSARRVPRPLIHPHRESDPALARVLVVEGHLATAEMALLVLSAAGYDSMHAANASQALALSERWHPDLVLLDLRLPDLHGVEVCRRLLVSGDAPIMVVSAERDPDVIESVLAAGAVDYLPKPFRTSELLTRIHARLHPDLVIDDRQDESPAVAAAVRESVRLAD